MIYDCFMFLNEFMLLEIRLKELYSVVDKFVLVEATHTHAGKEKRLYYNEAKTNGVLAPYRDKIIHVIYEMSPDPNRFQNENDQRNAILDGLSGAEPDDVIIISDTDEVINHQAIPIIKQISSPTRLMMKLFYYYFNCQANVVWLAPVACRFKDYQTAYFLRNTTTNYGVILNAGWHFSYLAPPEEIARKLEAFAHAKYDTDYYKNTDRLRKCVEAGEDIFERPNMSFSIEPLDAPECVMNNVDKYRSFIKGMRRSGTQFISEIR